MCEAGYYCGSNETTALAMYTGGESWDRASDDAGMCFNGTYCATGMDRAPGVCDRDARTLCCDCCEIREGPQGKGDGELGLTLGYAVLSFTRARLVTATLTGPHYTRACLASDGS